MLPSLSPLSLHANAIDIATGKHEREEREEKPVGISDKEWLDYRPRSGYCKRTDEHNIT